MQDIVNVLDRILLVLMIIEPALHGEGLVPRAHAHTGAVLIVGLIAVTRRILIVTAQLAVLLEKPNDVVFKSAMLELALLTLRKRSATLIPERPEAQAS
jgi:hypothetical protein